jgi:hypothetical protein
MEAEKTTKIDYKKLKKDADRIKSGMGVVAWAVLEMFKRGGMPAAEVKELHKKMDRYFANPSNDECNAILKVVEARVQEDKEDKDLWYV